MSGVAASEAPMKNLESKLTEANRRIAISETLPIRIKIARMENMDIDSGPGKARIKELENLTNEQLALFLTGAERRAVIKGYGLEIDSVDTVPQFDVSSPNMATGNAVGYVAIPEENRELINNVKTRGFGGR